MEFSEIRTRLLILLSLITNALSEYDDQNGLNCLLKHIGGNVEDIVKTDQKHGENHSKDYFKEALSKLSKGDIDNLLDVAYFR